MFRDGGRQKVPLPKICYTYPTMMKLGTLIPYLEKIQKQNNSRDTSLDFCRHQHFFTISAISKFCYIKKYRYRLHFDTLFVILLTFFESSKILLINMFSVLMMSAKMATLDLCKIKVFWNKGYEVITSVWRQQQKFITWLKLYYRCLLSCDQKFHNSSTSLRELIITSILYRLDQINHFFKGWTWLNFNNLGLTLDIALKFYTSVAKGL